MNFNHWDERFEKIGHTGYGNKVIYNYDQLLRLKVIGRIVHKFQGPIACKNILDIGCGIGDFSILFAENGANVVGIDISEKAIEKARRRAKGLSCVFLTDSIKDVSLITQSFDMINSITVLQHIPDDQILISIQKIATCLNNGGNIFILETAPTKVNREMGAEFIYFRTEDEYIRLFESEGVKLISKMFFPSFGLSLIQIYAKLAKFSYNMIFFNRSKENSLHSIKQEYMEKTSPLFYINNAIIKTVLFFSKPFDYYLSFLIRFGTTKIMIFKKVDN